MSDDELLDTETERSVEDVADWLRTVADDLESGEDDLTISVGEESATVAAPTGDLEFEVELERESENGSDEIELEIELEWLVPAEQADDEELEITDGDDD